MNRRIFLRTLAAGLATTLDPERLLWQPGKKVISIPKAPPTAHMIISEALRNIGTGSGGLFNPRANVAAQYDFALRELNSMLDRWNTEPLILRWPDPPPYIPDSLYVSETITKEEFSRRYPSPDPLPCIPERFRRRDS